MTSVLWSEQQKEVEASCLLCGNDKRNIIVLSATHWHKDRPNIELARCAKCHSLFTVDAHSTIVPYPNAEDALKDPNFPLLVYHYLEICSGIDWKLHLLERLPYQLFKSVLEVGCNAGVTLDYCRTNWNVKATGLEPSAYGVVGATLLDIPLLHSYTHEATELKGRTFDLVFATEVLEHVENPLSFLKELRSFLEPDGVLLLTTPSSYSVSRSTPPGNLYAAISPGAHYFLASPEQLSKLAELAGFKYCKMDSLGISTVAAMSDNPLTYQALPNSNQRLALYYRNKLSQPSSDKRAYLGHLMNYLIFATHANCLVDKDETVVQINGLLLALFDVDLNKPLALAERLIDVQSIFDLGRTVPYSLPFYLDSLADHQEQSMAHLRPLALLVASKGLQVDFQNLFVYHSLLTRLLAIVGNSDETADPRVRVLIGLSNWTMQAVPELRQLDGNHSLWQRQDLV